MIAFVALSPWTVINAAHLERIAEDQSILAFDNARVAWPWDRSSPGRDRAPRAVEWVQTLVEWTVPMQGVRLPEGRT